MIIRRVFAFLIDLVIATLFSAIPIPVISGLIAFLYMLLRDGLTERGSIGKRMLNLQVTTLGGQQLNYEESIRRNIIFAFPTIFHVIPVFGWILAHLFGLFIYVVELLAMNKNPRGQRNGDRWAGTLVQEGPHYY
ncbi:MAG: RDD family protein [Bacillota bacterium]